MGLFTRKSINNSDEPRGENGERDSLMSFIEELREREEILMYQLAKQEKRIVAMSKRKRRQDEQVELLGEVISLLNRLDAAVVVRDPGSARSAEAFDGLRRTVIAGAKARRAHVSHLLALRDSIANGATVEAIANRINDFVEELGLFAVENTDNAEWFEIVEGEGDHLECIEPAVVDETELGRVLIRPGKARRFHASSQQGIALEGDDDDAPASSDNSEESAEPVAAPADTYAVTHGEAGAETPNSVRGEADPPPRVQKVEGEEQ